SAAGVTTDQRGLPRIVNGTVDIGAFESNTPQTITYGPRADTTNGDADFAIRATATSGLPVSFADGGNASVQRVGDVWYVYITGAGTGTATITTHWVFTGNGNYKDQGGGGAIVINLTITVPAPQPPLPH